MNTKSSGPALVAAGFLLAATAVFAEPIPVTTYATVNGDAQYSWNSKYGPYGYTEGTTTLGVGLYMGAPYGNDYTMGIIEIPIIDLRAGELFSANIKVYSEGFGTGYYYGSAGLTWIAPSMAVTGNPVTDGIGSMLGGPSIEYTLWNSDNNEPAGWFTFDITAHVQTDLTAGRNFSTFVLAGSRDTGGGIRAVEYGSDFGARIEAVIPEPVTYLLLLGPGTIWLTLRRRLRK